ncbi:MAG TPA: sugar O-acetyltransferase [Parafilimonas sp.]|nr:sugar O-acetyltransferase [Parafilimonas sp.]
MVSTHNKDIFEGLRNGEVIPSSDPDCYKLRHASFVTKRLLVHLNNSCDAAQVRDLLSQITGTEIDKSDAVFTPLYINYRKNTKIGRNVFINFDCVFLDLGGMTIEDGVLIAPKVTLLSEGHQVSPMDTHSFVPGHIYYISIH